MSPRSRRGFRCSNKSSGGHSWWKLLVCALFLALAYGESREHAELFSIMRDWVPMALLLLAYREMDWFSTLPRNFDLELRWVEWDRTILYQWGLQRAIESLGALGPLLSGALLRAGVRGSAVRGGDFVFRAPAGPRERRRCSCILLGTLLAYALFPYFPSDPPRVAFGGSDMPNITTAVRAVESVAGGRLRHSLQRVSERARIVGIFGGVGAARFSAGAQGDIGWGMLVYAVSVAVATVYGRYHYAADAVAGLAVSLVPGGYDSSCSPSLRVHGLLELP